MKEFNSTANNVIEALYDFALCRRPDGSIYGIVDGAQCRKGVPTKADESVSRDEVLGNLKELAGKTRKLSSKEIAEIDEAFDKLSDSELSNIANSSIATLAEGLRRKENDEEVSRFPGLMSWEEIEGLDKNRDRLMKGFDDPSTLTSSLRSVREEEVDAFLLIAGKGFSKGDGLGSPDGTPRVGLNEDGTHSVQVTDWRRRQLAKRFLQQEGKDLYTGLPLAKVDAALEHIQPYSSGYKTAEQVSNWGWISRVVNDKKEGASMAEFFERHVDPNLKLGKESYTREYDKIMDPIKMAWRLSRKNIEANQEFAEKLAVAYRDEPRKILQRLYHTNKNDKVRYGKAHSPVPSFDRAPLSNGQSYGTVIIRNWGRLDDAERSRLTAFSRAMVEAGLSMKKQGLSNKEVVDRIGKESEVFFRERGYEL